jgi:hypothetical protein
MPVKKKKTVKKKTVSAESVQPVVQTKNSSKTLAIIGLLINILILPGLGSIIGGRTKEGIWQLVLLFISGLFILFGIPLSLIIIGIPMIILGSILSLGVWVWSIYTGVQMIQAAS